MATLKYTNCMLTLIAACLLALTFQRPSMISTAVAQTITQPTPVTIVGFQLSKGLPVNIAGLSGHPSIPVEVVGQIGKIAVSISDAVPVTNSSDNSPLSVQMVKSP